LEKLKEWAGVLASFGALAGVLITLAVLVLDTNDKIQDTNDEIHKVDRDLSEKLELTERRVMDKLAVIEPILARIDERTARTDDRLARIEARLVAVEKTAAQLEGKVAALGGPRLQAFPISDWSRIENLKDLPAGIVWMPAPIPEAAKTEKSE